MRKTQKNTGGFPDENSLQRRHGSNSVRKPAIKPGIAQTPGLFITIPQRSPIAAVAAIPGSGSPKPIRIVRDASLISHGSGARLNLISPKCVEPNNTGLDSCLSPVGPGIRAHGAFTGKTWFCPLILAMESPRPHSVRKTTWICKGAFSKARSGRREPTSCQEG
jgi:hypothetical protein